jgi:uncharacterized protein YbjQ (UPF0145 family)
MVPTDGKTHCHQRLQPNLLRAAVTNASTIGILDVGLYRVAAKKERFMVLTNNCARCGQTIDATSSVELEKLRYCFQCAHQVQESLREKKVEVNRETQRIMKVRDIIEEELAIVSEEDTRHIALTTTDYFEGTSIGEYIDVISIQDVQCQHIPLILAHDADNSPASEQVENVLRRRMKLGLSKLKKRAYLAGADAVVGIRINSAINTMMHNDQHFIGMTKVNVTGTAVRLIT